MNVLIVEGHPVFRDIMGKIISDWFPHGKSVCANDGVTAIQLLRSQVFTQLLLDLHLPDIDAFALADAALEITPAISIIALTSTCDDYTVYRTEKRRVRGFVDKRISTAFNFHQAIANVEADLAYHSTSFLRLKSARRTNPVSFDKILSDREIEILALIATPFSDTEIAHVLGISKGTVEKHRFNLLRKLELETTVELVRYARNHGIVAPPPQQIPREANARLKLSGSASLLHRSGGTDSVHFLR